MESADEKLVYTIGHSTHSAEDFLALLKSFGIEQLIDIRRYPGSRRYPHFNKEALAASLSGHNIDYIHLEQLGGRRTTRPDSKNTAWRHAAFRGYADYMEHEEFKKAMDELEELAAHQRTVYMCSEAVWWSCHRSLVSDYLKVRGWKVLHIMAIEKAQEHPYTSPAKIVDGKLIYATGNNL
ncbi:MAG TPA: DUF488 domain-containing protein [Ohtaekwangia sp.]|nr:DUF488 domain-containing protein [Ohtaekwangia sp.]